MNYELAKELKAAGFPQQNPEYGQFDRYETRNGEEVFKPTLEELIAAVFALVPDKFLDLSSRSDRDQLWSATSTWCIGSGSTPEEAVARLWLALQNRT